MQPDVKCMGPGHCELCLTCICFYFCPQRRQALSDPETVRRSMDPANLQAMLQMQAAMQQLQASGLMPADPAAGMLPGLGGMMPPAAGVRIGRPRRPGCCTDRAAGGALWTCLSPCMRTLLDHA